MKIDKSQTDIYILAAIESLDPITVYVTNYSLGRGKVVIECYGRVWSCYWGSMGSNTLQKFLIKADADYILGKMLQKTNQIDFEKINETAEDRGFSIHVEEEIDIGFQGDEMRECFGDQWLMELPSCETSEYRYLGRIITAVKTAFSEELEAEANG